MSVANPNSATLQIADDGRTSAHADTIRFGDYVACALSATAAWLLLFVFGRHISYGGDDSVVLVPLFHDGLAQSMGRFFRPLEYLAAWLSHGAGLPLWLYISAMAYVATAVGTLRLASAIDARRPPFWKILVCAVTPLAAQPYFQIDTVSQALANLFSLAFIIASLGCFFATQSNRARRYAWYMVLLAVLCVLSKETALGILFAGTAMILLRHRLRVLAPVLCLIALMAASVLFRVIYKFGTGSDAEASGLGLNFNPLYAAFNFVFSVAVSLAPVPTSITLSGAFTRHPALLVLVTLGILAVVFAAIVHARSLRLLPAFLRTLTLRIDRITVTHLLLVYLAFSVVPTVFFKGAELYASQMTPILKVLLLAIPVAAPLAARGFWYVCSALWLLASTVNVMYYSVATGYEPGNSALYAPIQAAVTPAPRVYSIYNPAIYAEDTYPAPQGDCLLSRRSPDICLPRSIGSGFPVRLSEQR